MKQGCRMVLGACALLILGCDDLGARLKEYDAKDLEHIDVQEIKAPRGVRCFVLVGTREKLGGTLSCFPVAQETGDRK